VTRPNPALQRTRLGRRRFNRRASWAAAYSQAHRAKGKSHACALRGPGQRGWKILWKMWQGSAVYDENLPMQTQQRHGSCILPLQPKKS
jgi:hypothetical protein